MILCLPACTCEWPTGEWPRRWLRTPSPPAAESRSCGRTAQRSRLLLRRAGLLAWAAAIPAAFARVVPDPGGQYWPVRPARVPPSIAPPVTTGGMAGWQITLIALGAALVAAAATIRLIQARAARRARTRPAA